MAGGLELLPTPAGLAVAATCVAAGIPCALEGWRVWRLSRALGGIRRVAVADAHEGFAHLAGKVVLESPLFAPLSGAACAAYRLEFVDPHGVTVASHSECRPFGVLDGDAVAHVEPGRAQLDFAVTTTREALEREALSENVEAILARSPEAQWLRRNGSVRLVETSLVAGGFCHVVGRVRHREEAVRVEQEWLRTGTDDVAIGGETTLSGAEVWVDEGGADGFLLVSDRSPEERALRLPRWRALGLVAGPALTIAGLVYLAHLAEQLRGARGF